LNGPARAASVNERAAAGRHPIEPRRIAEQFLD